RGRYGDGRGNTSREAVPKAGDRPNSMEDLKIINVKHGHTSSIRVNYTFDFLAFQGYRQKKRFPPSLYEKDTSTLTYGVNT
ncbi:MAG: hypothetical protein K2X81_04530, partial [Candidatus Obscuribacterales bacterium]|nr:hypothetical protein [Candidatus Obscuribacterales bacterium]